MRGRIKELIQLFIVIWMVFGAGDKIFSSFISPKRPRIDKYCFDFAKVLDRDLVREINIQGQALKNTFDIDFVVVIVPSLDGRDIVEYTAELFSNWKIGKNTKGRKGLLILIALKEQKVKIEVGYDLEHIFTDLYVAQVEREMLKEFLEQADWQKGFLATIENFVERIYKMYERGQDVREVSSEIKIEYYSGGAGAQTVFDFGKALRTPPPQTSQALRQYFSAQPTPELAFRRYMEHCAWNISDYSLELFNDRTKQFFKYWHTSTGQRRSEAEQCSGVLYAVRQKGKWAVVFFPNPDPIKMAMYPVYLIEKTEKGWQMDLDAMARGLSYGGRFVHWVDGSVLFPYVELFMSDYTLMPNMSVLVRKDSDVGTFGIYYLGNGLYDPLEPGVHIGIWTEELSIKTGLKDGDSIIEIDGYRVKKGREGERLVAKFLLDKVKVGDRHRLRILRNGQQIILNVEAQPLPDAFARFKRCFKVPRVWLGIYMATTTEVEQRYAHTYCVILDVAPRSPAEKAGLKRGDIILSLNEKNEDIYTGDILKLLEKLKPGEKVKMVVLRNLKDRINITIIAEETSQQGYF